MLVLWMCTAGLILVFSRQVMECVQQVSQTFVASVLPALFPMMILGGLMHPGRHRTGKSIFLVLFGFCAGSPASARQTALLHTRCSMPRGHLMPLLCMCGVMSPMFFIGSLGARIGRQAGWVMLLAHWLSALATGAVCTVYYRCKQRVPLQTASRSPSGDPPPDPSQNNRFPLVLPEAITGAAQALLSVFGAMTAFGVLAALLKGLAELLFPVWAETHPEQIAFLWALLEVGGGSFALLEHAPPLWVLCALCSFGGLSIWMQNLLFLREMNNPMELLVWRGLHGVLGGLCCFVLLRCFPAAKAAAAVAPAQLHNGLLPLLLLLMLAFPTRRRSF